MDFTFFPSMIVLIFLPVSNAFFSMDVTLYVVPFTTMVSGTTTVPFVAAAF